MPDTCCQCSQRSILSTTCYVFPALSTENPYSFTPCCPFTCEHAWRAVFGFYEETGTRNTYINNRVVPYPGAVGSGGAREAPLQSALADGFHAGSGFQGPTLIGNTFLNMGDDGIAIHGHFYLVVGVGFIPLLQWLKEIWESILA